MEYKVKEVCQLLGVSSRALRYYEELGMISPERDIVSGYRIYHQRDLNRIVLILIYRELGYSLKDIKKQLEVESIDDEEIEQLCSKLQLKQRKISTFIDDLEELINELKRKDVSYGKKS